MGYIFLMILTLIFFEIAIIFQKEKEALFLHPLINRYKEFCQIFSLEQIITCTTHVTCNTPFLIGYILTNSTENIFQSSIADSAISSANFVYQKKKHVIFNKHNFFLNYEHFSNTDAAYTDLLNKLMKLINEITPSKELRVKNNNQDWFHRELNFKKQKLHIDKEIYKKVRNQVQNYIKKRSIISMKLTLGKK